VELGKMATETFETFIFEYGEEILSHSRTCEWFDGFKKCRTETVSKMEPLAWHFPYGNS
jgi:hypothetical protein